MKIQKIKTYLIFFILSIIIYGCSPSDQNESRVYKQFNDIPIKEKKQTSKAEEIAEKYNAIFAKPYSKDWSRKYTYEVQEKFKGKKVIFEARLVDIYKTDNGYQLQFGNDFISNTTFFLTSTYDVVSEISKSYTDSKSLIVVATIKSIRPFLSNKSDHDPITIFADRLAFGQSYVVEGSLDDYILE